MKRKNKRIFTPLEVKVFLTLALCIVAVVILAISNRRRAPEITKPGKRTRTMSEMEDFFVSKIQGLLVETLPSGRFRIPEIQEVYTALRRDIVLRYNKDIVIAALREYLPESKNVLMGAHLVNGAPAIDVIIPALMDNFDTSRHRYAPPETLEFDVLVGFLHEMQHLVYDFGPQNHSGALTFDELVAAEKRTWAMTCEQVIRPLVEKYNAPLSTDDLEYYNAWVRSGRDVNSPEWDSSVRKSYSVVR